MSVDPYETPNSDVGRIHDDEDRIRRRDAKALRRLVIFKVLLLFGGIYISVVYFERQDTNEKQASPDGLTSRILAWPLVIASMASWVGLLLLKKWAGCLFTLTYLFMSVWAIIIVEDKAQHPLLNMIDWLATGASFMIIALAFFSQALKPPRGGTR